MGPAENPRPENDLSHGSSMIPLEKGPSLSSFDDQIHVDGPSLSMNDHPFEMTLNRGYSFERQTKPNQMSPNDHELSPGV